MNFQPSQTPEPLQQGDRPEKASPGKLNALNIINALSPLVLAWIIDNTRKQEETDLTPASQVPQDRLTALKNEISDQLLPVVQSEVVVRKPEALLSHLQIESDPAVRNKKTGTTLCSYTTRTNFSRFGIEAPRGDACEVAEWYLNRPEFQGRIVQAAEYPGNKLFERLKGSPYPVADVFVKSKSQYGHRATAFRSAEDGRWYILDPYRGGIDASGKRYRTSRPIPVEEYSGEVKFAVFLDKSINDMPKPGDTNPAHQDMAFA